MSCSTCHRNKQAIEKLPPRERAFVDEYWRVLVHRSALPGWLVVVLRRHVESLADLSVEEASSLGSVLSGGTQALTDVVGSVKSYAMLFGEGMPHLHFNLVPRMRDVPESLRGPKVFSHDVDSVPLEDVERDALAVRLAAAWPEHVVS